jgi:hypothetical protein
LDNCNVVNEVFNGFTRKLLHQTYINMNRFLCFLDRKYPLESQSFETLVVIFRKICLVLLNWGGSLLGLNTAATVRFWCPNAYIYCLSEQRIDATLKPWHHAECCPKNISTIVTVCMISDTMGVLPVTWLI